MLYTLFVPKQAVGANLVYFDLWHAGVGRQQMQVLSVLPIVSGAVAVTGVVSVDLLLTRTSAVGTGGTAATYGGTDTTACTINPWDGQGDLTAGDAVTARLTPSGGATAGRVLSWTTVFSEETNAGTYLDRELVRRPLLVGPGTGIRVVQGAVASVGNIGFNVLFTLQ